MQTNFYFDFPEINKLTLPLNIEYSFSDRDFVLILNNHSIRTWDVEQWGGCDVEQWGGCDVEQWGGYDVEQWGGCDVEQWGGCDVEQ